MKGRLSSNRTQWEEQKTMGTMGRTKGIGIASLLLAGVVILTQGTLARALQGPEQKRGFSADRITQQLNLTEEQKSRVQQYLEDSRSQLQVLRNDASLTREQRAQRMREIGQQTREKIQSLLTVEQKQKAEELRNQAQDRMRQEAGRRFDRTARLLDLTPEQKTQMQSLRDSQRAQLEALRDNTSLTQEQRRQQAQAIREQTRNNTRSLLNPTQQQKFNDLREGARERFRGRRGRGGFGGPGAGGFGRQERGR